MRTKPKSEDFVLLRVDEAAERLSISRARMYRMLAAGAIPYVRLGQRGRRVSIEALRKWARDREERGTAAA